MAIIEFIIKRNRTRVSFDKTRIFNAIGKAFLSDNRVDTARVAMLTDEVCTKVENRGSGTETTVEFVQDVVEEVLMRNGFHRIAKNYILYRQEQKKKRQEKVLDQIKAHKLEVAIDENETAIFEPAVIQQTLKDLSRDLTHINIQDMVDSITQQIYDRISKKELQTLVLGAARDRIEQHYEYAYLASRIALNDLYKSILNASLFSAEATAEYKNRFKLYIQQGIGFEMLNPELSGFNLDELAAHLEPERDTLFEYLGIQILTDRYFLRNRSAQRAIYELPQWFWMRVAMGLALKEAEKTRRAVEFYHVLSKMDLVSSTPTLFNSGTLHSQMSSCYINIPEDSLESIFKSYSDNAKLSKWAGGIGTDWTPIRATGSKIKGTNGLSQGVIPFIKIFNDVALAVNQGGKRKGAMCAYMEVWHLDYEQFLELKKNTGDERRRAHDVNTASWIPDLFMKRVKANSHWTFFCPSEVADLHDLYGKAFEERYAHYESLNLPRAKRVQAVDLWRKMLTMLYETGHPWVTFKDAVNVRSPQDHCGVVHSSNLCTEITLNTSPEETAVCNLASLNLAKMVKDGHLDEAKIAATVETGIRMLDNVIDNNYYPIPEAERANLRHRAVGLGLMGFQDAVYQLNASFDSDACMQFADQSMEMISYYAILASSKLAKERSAYPSYKGSKWSRGILPYDTLKLLEEQRGLTLQLDRGTKMDWAPVRDHVAKYGMRNSNTMAIAPTATIANIAGVYPCTEPAFKNIYMKENLSGNFLIVNKYLIDDLATAGLWTDEILKRIKLNNGSVTDIVEIPQWIRDKYKEVFEIDQSWIIRAASLRAKWIDQSASTNVFMATSSGKALHDTYFHAWETGLKTTYYFRTMGASQVKKTIESQPTSQEESVAVLAGADEAPRVCLLSDPDCEACQ